MSVAITGSALGGTGGWVATTGVEVAYRLQASIIMEIITTMGKNFFISSSFGQVKRSARQTAVNYGRILMLATSASSMVMLGE